MIIWMYCLTLKLCCLVAVYHGHANLIHLFHVHRWVLIVIPCFIARDDWLLLQSRLFLVSTPQETDSLNTLLSPLGAVQGHARTAASLCPEPPTLRFSPSSLLTGWAQKGHVSHTGVQAGGRCFLVQVYDFIYGPISPAVANKKLWFKTGTTHDHLSNFVLISIVCVFVLPPPFSSSWFVYHLVSYLSNSSSLPISPIKMENSCAFRCCLFFLAYGICVSTLNSGVGDVILTVRPYGSFFTALPNFVESVCLLVTSNFSSHLHLRDLFFPWFWTRKSYHIYILQFFSL